MSPAKQRGITLLELLIAAALLASILVISERSITGAHRAGEISEKRSKALRDIDRLWILLENDLRNSVAFAKEIQFSEPLPAMRIDPGDTYLLSLLRGGQANPLLLPRTEVLRVAYRIEENVLWRDSWVDPYNPQEETARQQQLMDNIEELVITVLPGSPRGRSVEEGPWLERWPEGNAAPDELPLAIEIKLTLPNRGELRRLITLLPGA